MKKYFKYGATTPYEKLPTFLDLTVNPVNLERAGSSSQSNLILVREDDNDEHSSNEDDFHPETPEKVEEVDNKYENEDENVH